MLSQDWEQFFAEAYANPLSAECCRLRVQLLDRTRAHGRPPFAEANNFSITDISNGVPRTHLVKDDGAAHNLDAAMAGDAPPGGVRMISVASERKTSPLEITQATAAKIFGRYKIKPEFLRVLLFFGGAPLESEARNSHISFHEGGDGEVCLGYRLNYFEQNPGGEWVPRQIGIYHHRYGKAAGSGSLFMLVAGTRKTRFWSILEGQLTSSAGKPTSTGTHLEESPWALHAALFSCYADSWRDYLEHLGSRFSHMGDHALGAVEVRVDDETISDVIALRHVYDESLFGGGACAGNVDIARALVTKLQGLLSPDDVRSLEASADMLEGLVESCKVLQKKIRNITDLVGYFITFHYQSVAAKLDGEIVRLAEENGELQKGLRSVAEQTKEVTEQLRSLTQSTANDGAIVTVITVVSAIYLPGSFVSSIFGMNFFDFNDQARTIAISSDIWIFIVAWIGLILATLGIFVLVYLKRSVLSKLWRRLGGAGACSGAGGVV
ncbi:hypothetical protein RB600_006859 [Gaeumannomyces tritici]